MVSCNVSDIWFLFVLNRLTGWQVQQGGVRTATHRMVYAANGNLTYMDGTGTLEYAHPEKPGRGGFVIRPLIYYKDL